VAGSPADPDGIAGVLRACGVVGVLRAPTADITDCP